MLLTFDDSQGTQICVAFAAAAGRGWGRRVGRCPGGRAGAVLAPAADWHSTDGASSRRNLICPPGGFRAQLDAPLESGHTAVSPDQYLTHLQTGAGLPDKPVLLTFDDSQGTQITEGLMQLQQREMTATFFVMTVVLGNPGWMTRQDVVALDAAGMTVAAHTWDHHRADRYTGPDWAVQLNQPRALLQDLLHKPVRHFAYPYGAWNAEDFTHLRAAALPTPPSVRADPAEDAEPGGGPPSSCLPVRVLAQPACGLSP